jgi:lipopolysaccharide transport system ATP-binding protein
MSIVIKIENLSKQYRLGQIGYGYLARDLESWWARLRGRPDPNAPIHGDPPPRRAPSAEWFWALEGVSLDIDQGEKVGIIGPNGAGKSTLLKIISRITLPSEGSVKIKGRVASLLEVGAGFHSELTGAENIYINGAMLGMSIKEIKKEFERIVEFAGLAPFIQTPVKRYSSGMFVRLAFAVAICLQSDIVVIDEVLASADAAFQRRCLGEIDRMAQTGRTVLFVSHNMDSVAALCPRSIYVKEGKIAAQGPTPEVITKYAAASSAGTSP